MSENREIKNAETESLCKSWANEYRNILRAHQEGSTEFIRARMCLSQKMMEWMRERNLVRWEQIAIADRVSHLARKI